MFNPVKGTRVVARPEAITDLVQNADWPTSAVFIHLADDELFVQASLSSQWVHQFDPYAVVISEAGFLSATLSHQKARLLLSRHCEWKPPATDNYPTQAQGALAGIPVKFLFQAERVVLLVEAVYAEDLLERMT